MSGLGFFIGTSLGLILSHHLKGAPGNASPKISTKDGEIVTVSAPGKILIAGGYLVLESPNVGVTIATTAKFFTSVKWESSEDDSGDEHFRIVVTSPQFHATYNYSYDWKQEKLNHLDASSNSFVEKCILLTFAFVQKFMGETEFTALLRQHSNGVFHIKLRADNDFYSQINELTKRKLPLLSSSLRKLPDFLPCPYDKQGNVDIAKTGLGSSAALTTSLVGALLHWFGVVKLGMRVADEDRRIVHNLAQLVHSNAQGKIGSGFDVAAAVYGTQTYTRFSSTAFSACMEESVPPAVLYEAVMNKDPSGGWEQRVGPFRLPPGLVIVLGDVCGGSSSTSMAREVLKWRKSSPAEAAALWIALTNTNASIAACFDRLNQLYAVDHFRYNESLLKLTKKKSAAWNPAPEDMVGQCLVELRSLFTAARGYLKRMGESAGVGIEPDSQTRLANATETIEGVVTALVPGAGGVDALVTLALSDAVRLNVEKLWSEWHLSDKEGLRVCPLKLKAEGGFSTGVNVCSLSWN